MPVGIPAQLLAGPGEEGVDGSARRALDGEDHLRQIRAGARRASQQPAVAGNDPGVIAVVMERMRIAAAADHPHEDFLAGVEHGHGVIGLSRQPGDTGRQHRVRPRPAVDEPIDWIPGGRIHDGIQGRGWREAL